VRDVLSRVFLVHPERRSWLAAAVWSIVAVASLAVAARVALQPGRLGDLHQVRLWLAYFLSHSADPYAYFDRQLDYPPVALVVLSPLHFIPTGALAAWFLPVSIAVTALAGWVFVGAIADRLYTSISLPHRTAIVALILSGSSVRGAIWLGQTVALSVLFGALALRWSRRRPFAAAVALALCSFKPHLAVGFGLAILMVEGADVIVVAVAIVISASLLIAAAVNQSVLAILANYAHNLLAMYDGPDRIRGLLSVRWVIDDLIGHYGFSSFLYALLACVSLILIGRAARRAPDAAGRTQATAAALLWPLLFLPSQLYNGVMAAPAIWLLMWPEADVIRRESTRLAAVSAFVILGVADVPRLVRLVAERSPAEMHWLYKGSYYVNPLRMAWLFGFLLLVAFRRTRPGAAEPAP
jgi:hypothetical protein